MDPSAILNPLLGIDLAHLTIALVLVAILLGLSFLYLAVKLRRINSLYKKLMQGSSGESIEKMMLERIREIEELKQTTKDLRTECARLDSESRKHIQKVGVVRFNAFDNTGSDLSFAVAMMDATRTGFVLSGIYGREESRVYAKPILQGESTYMLTEEEKQALAAASKK
jgi:hypothetical protein